MDPRGCGTGIRAPSCGAYRQQPDIMCDVAVPRRRLRTKVRSAPYPAETCETKEPSACGKTETAARLPKSPWFPLKEQHAEYAIVGSAFDKGMLEQLEAFLKRKRPQPAKMKIEGAGSDDERKARYADRDSRTSWFNAKEECPFLHNRLVEVVRDVGNVLWPILRTGPLGMPVCEYEETQYAVYGPGQHFQAWHQDAYGEGHDPEDARQITLVAMLTPTSAYTGGQLQAKVKASDGKRKVIKRINLEAGDIVVFPAKDLVHRVSPVKTGTRKTLVFWAYDRESCKYTSEVRAGIRPEQRTKLG